MKFKLSIIAVIILISCHNAPHHKNQVSDVVENWQLKQVVKQWNSYNSLGLLDTTNVTEDIYQNGQKALTFEFRIKRIYDSKNNLISEKKFAIDNGKKQLEEEKIFEYDVKNNQVLEVDKDQNSFARQIIIDKIVKSKYNNNNQKIEETEMLRKIEPNPANWNLDSATAHEADKQIVKYDTFNVVYEYDSNGNQIKKTYLNPGRKNNSTLVTLYSGNQKIIAFNINSSGDTTSTVNYEKQDNLTAEIWSNKIDSSGAHETWYNGTKKVKEIEIDKRFNRRSMSTYKYDEQGNEIEIAEYK